MVAAQAELGSTSLPGLDGWLRLGEAPWVERCRVQARLAGMLLRMGAAPCPPGDHRVYALTYSAWLAGPRLRIEEVRMDLSAGDPRDCWVAWGAPTFPVVWEVWRCAHAVLEDLKREPIPEAVREKLLELRRLAPGSARV